MDGYTNTTGIAGDSPPSEAWLFAQTILGRPIPRVVTPTIKARTSRAELERLAQFSFKHAQVLHRVEAAQRDARHNRELLEWAAQVSPGAHEKLRAINQDEVKERRAWHAIELFTEADPLITEWNETDHPRAPKGTPIGGQWIEKGGGGGGTSTGAGRPASSKGSSASGAHGPNPHMLDLAHAWWQTRNAIEHARRDIEELPKRIKRYQSQVNTRYGYLYKKHLAKAQEELETAKSLVPQLEAQMRNLKQEFHDAGFDEVPYWTFTPAETIVGGKGIEEVGRAVARSGTPRGLQSTGIEFEIASAILAAPAILRLGKALLGRAALRKAATRSALGKQVAELHGTLDRIAQTQRTTAILETSDGTRIVASGGRDLTPAQKALLGPADVAAKLPGAHAELTALEHAIQKGLWPTQITVSRPFCPECIKAIEAAGGKITSPTTAVFPR
jgi:hypothetical protein